jgi:hypothetical protein
VAAAKVAVLQPALFDGAIELELYHCKGLVHPAPYYQGLMTQWNKVLRRLQKAAEV